MDNNNESKAERFVRLAEPRVSRACKAISLIGHLAASSLRRRERTDRSGFGVSCHEKAIYFSADEGQDQR